MNRKYDKLSAFSFQKAISFKTATVIVIALHLIGFFGITQWSAYKTKLSREKRQEEYAKRMELAETEKFNWPEGKTKIMATSPTPKPVSSVIAKQHSSVGFFDKIVAFFSFNGKSTTPASAVVADKSIHKDEARDKKVAEITTLIDHATNRLSTKAKELAALEASLKEKQKLIDDQVKKQQKAAIALSKPLPQPTAARSTTLPSSSIKAYETKPQTTSTQPTASSTVVKTYETKKYKPSTRTASSPTIISPETVRTYTKNGMQYIDVVETSKILSSHIVLQ